MFASRTGWDLTPNRFTLALEQHKKSGRPLLDLTASNPTDCGLKYESGKIIKSLCSTKTLKYQPIAQGLPAARQAVATYYQTKSVEISADNIILTTSTSEGYSFLFRLLCNAEDEILVPKPSYPLFGFLADLQDVKLVPYPLIYDHGWQIDVASLYKAVNHRTRAVIVVHPNNPTGSYVRDDELHALNSFCREYNVALVSDEVFLDYPHDGAPRSSFVRNRETLSFTLSGLSKVAGLPQMKLAWIAASGPSEQLSTALARLEVIADTFLSMNAPIQWAAPELLQQRKNVQPLLLDRLRANLEELDRQLGKQTLIQRLDVEGGWYAVLRVPATRSDEDLAIEIMTRCSVLVHPGHFYDFPRDGYLVVSLITPPQDFREGVRRVLELVVA